MTQLPHVKFSDDIQAEPEINIAQLRPTLFTLPPTPLTSLETIKPSTLPRVLTKSNAIFLQIAHSGNGLIESDSVKITSAGRPDAPSDPHVDVGDHPQPVHNARTRHPAHHFAIYLPVPLAHAKADRPARPPAAPIVAAPRVSTQSCSISQAYPILSLVSRSFTTLLSSRRGRKSAQSPPRSSIPPDKLYLDSVVQEYGKHSGITLSQGGVTGAAGGSAGGAMINSEEFEKFQQSHGAFDELDSTQKEHGKNYIQGIQPVFDPPQACHFDSAWNWARQTALEMFFDII
ncbi:hypothetical protein PCASD_20918 [Puccinia coronata f. sp. avenae]|uniref:Fatty acid synthase type I helical domain-containing protein n=1 Tax=Puccinia coronata f. sp. avenae TaxID=200324 RepID=A0A2N5TVV0_9BASI|nr:hypothetical protein PCASD_20918 [Puccinia coronata f. sp. avenae]